MVGNRIKVRPDWSPLSHCFCMKVSSWPLPKCEFATICGLVSAVIISRFRNTYKFLQHGYDISRLFEKDVIYLLCCLIQYIFSRALVYLCRCFTFSFEKTRLWGCCIGTFKCTEACIKGKMSEYLKTKVFKSFFMKLWDWFLYCLKRF